MLDSAAVSIVFLGLLLSAVSGLLFPYGGAVVIGLTLLNTAIAYYLFRALAEIIRIATRFFVAGLSAIRAELKLNTTDLTNRQIVYCEIKKS